MVRIRELLSQRLLDPEYTMSRAASFHKDIDRVVFKRRMVLSLIKLHPEVSKIVLWEDDEEQLAAIQDVSKRKKINFVGNHVDGLKRNS